MFSRTKQGARILAKTVVGFFEDDCVSMAASLAYYTMFSLPPLLVIIIAVLGDVFTPDEVKARIETDARSLVGAQGAAQVRTILRNASPSQIGMVHAAVGAGVLLFVATGVLAQLQYALNRAWKVPPSPRRGWFRELVLSRLLSFAMILGMAFLLLVSLMFNVALSAAALFVSGLLPPQYARLIVLTFNSVVSFGVTVLLFAGMFRVLPEVQFSWKDIGVGALVTAVLFVTGKVLIGVYLGNSKVGAAYGAAGSLAVILVWVYYSSLILLLGAEFTYVWTRRHELHSPGEPDNPGKPE